MTPTSFVRSTGTFVPQRRVTNDELAQKVDTSDEWIKTRTGIRARHLIDYEGHMGTADMAEHAARQALKDAMISASDLDMIVFATVTPDYRLPSAACILQNKLGAKKAFAYDVVAACAGSLYALNVAHQFTLSGQCSNTLVIGGETMTSITNWSDRNTCVLFGDAASAAIIQRSPNPQRGFLDFSLKSDGSHWQTIWIPKGGSKNPLQPNDLADRQDRVLMNGRETYKFAVKALTDSAKEILEKNHLKCADVKHVVAHQANLRIIEAVAQRLDVPMDRFVINIDRYANTSSASLLTTFDEAQRQGRFQSGDLILFLAIGAGFAWGAGLYRY